MGAAGRGMIRQAWERVTARGVSAAAVLVSLLWLALIAMAWLASRITGEQVVTCVFKRLTGYPCATCGGTRAASRLAHGDIAGAIQLNPLATAIVIGVPLLLVWWVLVPPPSPTVSKKRSQIHPRVQLAILLLVVAVNWAYVLWRFGRGEV